MFIDTTFPPPGSGRLAQFARLLADFERDEIKAAVDGLIAMLDARDGDADREPNGDEHDVAVVDWTGRDPAYRAELRDAAFGLAGEDCESDGDDEDEVPTEDAFCRHDDNGPGCPVSDPDLCADDSGDVAWVESGEAGGQVQHTCGHEDAEPEDVVLTRRQRDRIRRTRCTHEPRRRIEWPLIDGASLPYGIRDSHV